MHEHTFNTPKLPFTMFCWDSNPRCLGSGVGTWQLDHIFMRNLKHRLCFSVIKIHWCVKISTFSRCSRMRHHDNDCCSMMMVFISKSIHFWYSNNYQDLFFKMFVCADKYPGYACISIVWEIWVTLHSRASKPSLTKFAMLFWYWNPCQVSKPIDQD